jgi:putative transposase
MPQSLAQLYVHLVFSTKERSRSIKPVLEPALHAYLAGTLNAIDCPAVKVGGVADHVHVLFRLSKNTALSDAVKAARVESSKWMKREGATPDFAWQAGYGAFSVSASHVEAVGDYIADQEAHHKKRTFQEEFRRLLERYQISYDEAYVWD